MKTKDRPIHRSAFTLLELLVVIAMIAILAGMLLPALSKAKAVTYRSTCANQQKQILFALTLYAENYRTFPTASWKDGSENKYWPSLIIRTLDRKNLYYSSPYLRCPAHKPEGKKYFISYNANGHLMPGTTARERINFQNLTLPQRTALLLDGDRLEGTCTFTGNSNNPLCVTVGNSAYVIASRHDGATVIAYADMHTAAVRLPTTLGTVISKDIIYYWKQPGYNLTYAK